MAIKKNSHVIVISASRRKGEKGIVRRIGYKENGKREILPFYVLFEDGEESCFRANELEEVINRPPKTAVQMAQEWEDERDRSQQQYVIDFQHIEEHLKAGGVAGFTTHDVSITYEVGYDRTGYHLEITQYFQDASQLLAYTSTYSSLEALNRAEPINLLKFQLLVAKGS